MVSKAVAALDAWWERAEEVLAEQREHAISQSWSPAAPRSEPSSSVPCVTTCGPTSISRMMNWKRTLRHGWK